MVHCWRKPLEELRQSRNLEAGADAEVMEGGYIIGFLPMAFSVCFLIELRTSSPKMAPTTKGWAFPSEPLIKKMPYSWILGIYHLMVLPFR